MMNGEGSTSNSFSGNFFVDERLATNSDGVVHHNLAPINAAVFEHDIAPANTAVCDDLIFTGRSGQSGSTVNTQNQDMADVILANGSVAYGASILGRAYSDALDGINLNTALGDNHNDVSQGYVLEDNVGRDDPSDRRHLTCKRRAPENASAPLLWGAGSSSSQRAGNSDLQPAHVQKDSIVCLDISPPLFNPPNISHPGQLERRLEIGMRRTHSDIYRTSNEVSQAESFCRNIRMRRALTSARDFVTPSILSTGTRRNSDLQSRNQSTVFSSFDDFHNLSSATTGPVHALPPVRSLVYASDSLQILHPSPPDEVVRSRNASSSLSPACMVTGDDILQQQQNIPRNITIAPETERRNLVCNLTNYSFDVESEVFLGTIASTSGIGSASGAHVSAAPTWTRAHLNAGHEERLSDPVNHSMNESSRFEFQGQHSFHTLSSGASATVQDMEYSVRGGNSRNSQVNRWTGLITRPVRQDNRPETLTSSHPRTITQRQGRLLSEVQSALAVLHRAGALRHEDLIIDGLVPYGLPEEDDMHEDMRLDVDNMSYEELLALEENMGTVSTGLSEKAILANLRQRKYQSISIETLIEKEPCCICQDNYVDEEDIGKLDCGHDFHVNCIKKWLMQKNSCPICKMTGLVVRHN